MGRRKEMIEAVGDAEQQQNYCQGYGNKDGHLVYEKLAYYNGYRLCSSCKAGTQRNLRKSHKDHRKEVSQLNYNVNLFATQNNIEIKCMSDKIQLYYRYCVSVITSSQNNPDGKERILDVCDRIYSNIRGDMRFTNKNPRMVAGAIVYVAYVIAGTKIRQDDVAVSLDMTDKTIRENYLYLKSALKL